MDALKRAAHARRITLFGTLSNIILTAFKFLAGFLANSHAMVADAVHSLTDLATDVVVLIGMALGKKPTDQCHRYGHGKFETLSTAFIGIALGYAGLSIGLSGGAQILELFKGGPFPARPGQIAFWVALVSIVTKEVLYRATASVGKRINSPAVIANAHHHRSDAFSSIGTALGIGAASFLGEGWTILDPLAALVVSIFIMKAAWGILKSSINELVEKSLPDSVHREIEIIACGIKGISQPHNIRTRMVGPAAAVDLHIRVEPEMSVYDAHCLTSELEKQLRERFGVSTFVNVHVEPDSKQAN